jgi:hypothetical protein
VLLLRQMAEIARRAGNEERSAECQARAVEAEKRLAPLRDLVMDPMLFSC